MDSDNGNQPHHAQWMPTAGGVLSIIAGSFGLVGNIFWLVFGNILGSTVLRSFFPSSGWQHWSWPFVIVGAASLVSIIIDILAITGGILAIQRKHWGWALTGGICAIIASRILGIIALVFVVISRKDFK